MAAGESNQEVARRLGLTEGSVKSRLCRLYKKLAVSNRAELASLYGRQRLEPPD